MQLFPAIVVPFSLAPNLFSSTFLFALFLQGICGFCSAEMLCGPVIFDRTGVKKSTIFANFLPLLEGARQFLSPAWRAAIDVQQSCQTIHTHSASQEIGAASSIHSGRDSRSPRETKGFVRVHLAGRPASSPCRPAKLDRGVGVFSFESSALPPATAAGEIA